MKPMLAATVTDVEALRYPLLASPKLDGVRALVINGVVMSRSMKPIPNNYVQTCYRKLEGFDGELIVGSPTAKDVYRQTVSGVMSEGGVPSVSFKVFDQQVPDLCFDTRLHCVDSHFRWPHQLVESPTKLAAYEGLVLQQGYEGVILRDPSAPYKQGRSTLREQGMLKLKRFMDDEAVVVGFEELMHNANPAIINELGHTAHSSHKANMVGRGTLGALVVTWQGREFRIGTGFTDAERQDIWNNFTKYKLLKTVKFKYLAVGMKDLPRHPVFLGWRDARDT